MCIIQGEPCSISAQYVIRASHTLEPPKISSFAPWSQFTTIAIENTSGFRMRHKNNTKRCELWGKCVNQWLSLPLNWHQNWQCSLHIWCQVRQKMSGKLQSTFNHQEQVFRVNVNQCNAGCVEARCQESGLLCGASNPRLSSGAELWPNHLFLLS